MDKGLGSCRSNAQTNKQQTQLRAKLGTRLMECEKVEEERKLELCGIDVDDTGARGWMPKAHDTQSVNNNLHLRRYLNIVARQNQQQSSAFHSGPFGQFRSV